MQMNTPGADNSGRSAPDLFNRTVKGGMWVFALRMLTQLFSSAKWIVLVKWLAVVDFGLIGIADLTMQALSAFTTTGFQAALIQKKKQTYDFLDTAWTIGIIRGVLLFVVIYFIAPLATRFRVDPEQFQLTVNIIRVLGFCLILDAVSNIGTIYFRKDLQFNKQFIFEIVSSVINITITISIAVIYRSIWAIAIGKLVGSLTKCVISYWIHPYRPKFKVDLAKAGELWGFGKWIFALSALGFIIKTGDDYFVWGYLGVASLGLYRISYRFAMAPATEISDVITQVTFPAYSKLQDDIPRLRDAYLKVLEFTAFLSIPLAGFIFALTPNFIVLFRKEDLLLVIPVMQILALRGMICSIGATRGSLFQSTGQPKLGTVIKLVKLFILACLIYPLTKRLGLVGTAWSIVIADAAVQPLAFYFSVRVISCRPWRMLKPIVMPFVATCIMIAAIYLLKIYLPEDSFVSFFGIALTGGCVYIVTVWILDRLGGGTLKKNICSVLPR